MDGFTNVSENLEKKIKKELLNELQIKLILEDAFRCERFLPKVGNRRAPSMWDLLETTYTRDEHGFYKKNMKLRANPKQIKRYDFAIDILLEVDSKIADNPVQARQMLWMRAGKLPFTKIAKHFGYHRTTMKLKYDIILDRLAKRINNKYNFDKIDDILYRLD